ncbi:MAG: tRNA pseudouridine(38-40) synthase TruA [Eubacteriales bacterium]|nr:tRNA pseudouridine(38-40) synthase TruA [Eubacteriales bacterium]MDD4186117.1 tRNA pseudouridine(38-40) synthase TruA [Eubacteriales bacterium]
MRRYAIMTEYDGTVFSGWQRQQNAPSVQAAMENSWFDLTGETIRLTGGSRTDAGVSALGHVSSFLSQTSIPVDRMALAWNTTLPESIAVKDVMIVEADFNPRYDGWGKSYRYTVVTGSIRPVLLRRQAVHVPGELDVFAMREAAKEMVGTHDFTAFMDQGSPTKRSVRTIHELSLEIKENTISFRIIGDGFLYHMVRVIAGTLVYAGQKKIEPGAIGAIIASKKRVLAGPTMPPEGLLLERVYFEQTLFGGDQWPYEDGRRELSIMDTSSQ